MIFNLKFIFDGSLDNQASIEVIFLEKICLLDPGPVSKKFFWLKIKKNRNGFWTRG